MIASLWLFKHNLVFQKKYRTAYSRAKNEVVELLFHLISFNQSIGTLATFGSLYPCRYGCCLARSRYCGAANPCIAHIVVIRSHFIFCPQSGNRESVCLWIVPKEPKHWLWPLHHIEINTINDPSALNITFVETSPRWSCQYRWLASLNESAVAIAFLTEEVSQEAFCDCSSHYKLSVASQERAVSFQIGGYYLTTLF